jgi:hypothetical protein
VNYCWLRYRRSVHLSGFLGDHFEVTHSIPNIMLSGTPTSAAQNECLMSFVARCRARRVYRLSGDSISERRTSPAELARTALADTCCPWRPAAPRSGMTRRLPPPAACRSPRERSAADRRNARVPIGTSLSRFRPRQTIAVAAIAQGDRADMVEFSFDEESKKIPSCGVGDGESVFSGN